MGSPLIDRLARLLAATPTRRTLGATAVGALGTLAAGLGLSGPEEAAAHNPMAACRAIRHPRKRRACLRVAKRHRQQHQRARQRARQRSRRSTCRGVVCPGRDDPANRVSCHKGRCRLARGFTVPGGPYRFTVPGRGELTVVAHGGGGGAGGTGGLSSDNDPGAGGGAGGLGARAQTTVDVRAGMTLDVFVGGAGGPGGPGGPGIGGAGGAEGVFGTSGELGHVASGPPGGGGGGGGSGGASRVVFGTGLQVVAGAGGGGGGGGGGGTEGSFGGVGGAGPHAQDGPGGPGGAGGGLTREPQPGAPGQPGTPGPGVNPGHGRVHLIFRET